MTEISFSGEISEEVILLQHLARIGELSTRIYENTSGEWQRDALNYVSAIQHYEAIVVRHLDAQYRDKLRLLSKIYRDKLLKYRFDHPNTTATELGKEYELTLTLSFARRKLMLLQRILDAKGVLTEKTYRTIENTPQQTEEENE
jgi:hypothetical protein